ncbi:MAG: 30S ribosomal protein S17 [Candidatus Moraniibacteriota bacterium]|nr:MAG: 30S ribosomal protein S17 [Candidatus Moranbacteria bacterium]
MTPQKSTNSTTKAPIFRGVVVSKAQEKTLVVSVETLKTHPKYRKKYRSTKRYQVHNPENKFSVGETVEFRECPPVSRKKRHRVLGNSAQ